MTNNPGLVIAAPASGSGKTVLTLGLLRHLASMGSNVASAKTGPDYIDPAFHAAATGRPCLNLDPWAMRPDTLAQAVFSLAREADVVICEGVMGLFDGAFVGKGEPCGSTADLSRATGWPVVLVIDAGAQAASAAAVLKGFATFEAGVEVLGVVFNRVGSERHGTILRDACAQSVAEIPVLGCLPRTPGLELPERHLGLVQAGEHKDLEGFLNRAGAWVAEHLDVDGLVTLARPLALSGGPPDPSLPPMAPLGQRIAVAADPAFAFSYPLVIDGWRDAGAEVVPFSPLAGEGPDGDADAVYLPGGYPELHAGALAAASGFMDGLALTLTSSCHLEDGRFLEASWDNYFYTRQWNVPPEVEVVPPTCPVFSTSRTCKPSSAPTSAAVMPPAPAPQTSRSTSLMSVVTRLSLSDGCMAGLSFGPPAGVGQGGPEGRSARSGRSR